MPIANLPIRFCITAVPPAKTLRFALRAHRLLIVWMMLLPSLFLAGFFFPLEAMPKVLQWISLVFPLRYYLAIIRSLMLKGVAVEALRTDILALAIFGTVIMTAAAMRFRKRLD